MQQTKIEFLNKLGDAHLINSDQKRLKQVLINLISNSVKVTTRLARPAVSPTKVFLLPLQRAHTKLSSKCGARKSSPRARSIYWTLSQKSGRALRED